ncbi:MAG: cheW [Pedosphaera sp.]|nr:cheW [Pedosphaera sp.]
MDPRHPAPDDLTPEPGGRAVVPDGIFDCWSKVGVSGDGTCPELTKLIHCRNCPIYSAAAAQLLDRQVPAEYRRQWTEHFSREKKPVVPGKQSIVIFRIGPEWLALPTRVFQEIAEQRTVHSLPHRQQGVVLGLINIRGELLICVSLGRLLGLEQVPFREKSRTTYDRLVVTEWQGRLLTFPVSEVYGIQRYQPQELQEPPATVTGASSNLIRNLLAWENKLVGCLDAELLFSTLNRSLA